jgi:16S rRNA (adenine1518-N6/adenine1519-N6)-dimethyltransferase
MSMAGPIPKKSLGQHWLDDEASLRAMLDMAAVGAGDTVVEIGPGLGTLTRLLVAEAEQVIAIEFDTILAVNLPQRIPAKNLQVVEQDILQFDFTSLPLRDKAYKVVANIPYYLTSNLIRVLSETTNPPTHMALLVQKEVAERIAAKPGAMSLLSVSAQWYWQVSLGPVVPAALFTPPPKVDSQIIGLERRTTPLFADVDPKRFFQLCRAGFGERRKTVRNSLSGGLRLEKPVVEAWLEAAGLDMKLRAQNLSLEQWYRLYQNWP